VTLQWLPLISKLVPWIKALIHSTLLILVGLNLYWGFTDQLGADPVAALLDFTGITSFNLLLVSLSISPLARRLRLPQLMKFRRMIGLYAFFYGLCHLLCYLLFELQLDWSLIASELIERPFIIVGMLALFILLLLAITSTQNMRRKMGASWQKLHNWVYLAVLLIALHYIWSVKSDLSQPLIYWSIALLLLWMRRRKLAKAY
jgi:sulfoxide reductase heme-binding subunit YedZ